MGAEGCPRTPSLADPGQAERLREALGHWSAGCPLEPLRFEKVGARAGLRGRAREVVGEGRAEKAASEPLGLVPLPAGLQEQLAPPSPIRGEV